MGQTSLACVGSNIFYKPIASRVWIVLISIDASVFDEHTTTETNNKFVHWKI
jgi:hypothetical protein